MSIIVLLVEDNDDHAASLRQALSTDGEITLVRARGRRSAEAHLEGADHIDLLVCDLRIPVLDDGLEQSSEHGFAVQATAARTRPGMPAMYLTGVAGSNIDALGDAASAGAVSAQLNDGRPLRMVQLFQKSRTYACAQEILDLAGRLRAVDAVDISGDADLVQSLDLLDRRALGLAARRWGGDRVEIEHLGGGLSGSRTLHVTVRDASMIRASVFAKIGGIASCDDERRRYRDFVDGVINHKAFPPLAEFLASTLGNRGCLVYKFADDWDGTLFANLQAPYVGGDLVEHLRHLTSAWNEIDGARRVTIGALRSEQISESVFNAGLAGVASSELVQSVQQFELTDVDVRLIAQHGDLHGANLLCSTAGPTMIDCGDIGLHPAALDPVALELSLVTHPASPLAGGAWPDDAEAEAWLDLPSYLTNCPCPELVTALRRWAIEVADERGFLIAAYQYLARQLKHPGARRELIITMISAVVARFGAL